VWFVAKQTKVFASFFKKKSLFSFFFFEKKKQKTFVFLAFGVRVAARFAQ
jgi:hypothetical protein